MTPVEQLHSELHDEDNIHTEDWKEAAIDSFLQTTFKDAAQVEVYKKSRADEQANTIPPISLFIAELLADVCDGRNLRPGLVLHSQRAE